jgi:hypothetical protein
MLTVSKVKAGTSEVKSPIEIALNPTYTAAQFSEVNLYWFSAPNSASSEVIVTDPNGDAVFTSDKTGENSEVFIPEVVGTYTATITAILIPGGDAKTKEDLLEVVEGTAPYVNVLKDVMGTSVENAMFSPNTGLDLPTKFSWNLDSTFTGPMSFLIEISDPDGEIIHSVSGDDVLKESGSYIHDPDILGEYTITGTATNRVGTTVDTDTIICEPWPAIGDGASLSQNMKGFAWYPKPDSSAIIAPRVASKWGWWFELQDCYNPGDRYYPQTPPYEPEGIPTGEPKHPYDVIFKYNSGNATEAKFEFIDPDGVVDFEKKNLELTQGTDGEIEINFWYYTNDYFPTKRGTYTGRLTLTSKGFVDPVIVEYDVPCYDDLADKENSPDIWFTPRSAQEFDTFKLEWNAKGGKEVAVEWEDSEGNVGTASSDTGSMEFYGVLGEYTASITCKLGGFFRTEKTRIDVTEYQEPIPTISFSSSNPMVDHSCYIRWDSRSVFPGRTAVVEWRDPNNIVLGTYTDLVGSSEKIIIEKVGTYRATIVVTTPEGKVVDNSTSVLSVPYSYTPPTYTFREDGLTFKHYTQLNGTGRTENGILYNVDIENVSRDGCHIALAKHEMYSTIDTKFEMSVDGGAWTDMPLGGVDDGAHGVSFVNYVGRVPWSGSLVDKRNVKIKIHMGPTLTKPAWDQVVKDPQPPGQSWYSNYPYNQKYDPQHNDNLPTSGGVNEYNNNGGVPYGSPSGYSFGKWDYLRLTIGAGKATVPGEIVNTLKHIKGSRGWNCSGKNIMDWPLAFHGTCPTYTNQYMHSSYEKKEPNWAHTGWGSQKHSRLTTFTVPAGVTTMYANCVGSGGRYSNVVGAPFSPPGGGAYASGSFSVTPGEVLTLQVHYTGNNDGYSAVKRANGSVLVKAVQGENGTRTLGGHRCKGGQASACVGSTKHSGGDGGRTGGPWNFTNTSNGYNMGGCGGAAGPGGKGGNGGDGAYGETTGSVAAQRQPQNGTGGSASGGSSSGVTNDYNNSPGNNHGHIQQGGCVGIIGKRQSGEAFSRTNWSQDSGQPVSWHTANHGSTSFAFWPVRDVRSQNLPYPEGYFGGGSWHGDNGGVYIWY